MKYTIIDKKTIKLKIEKDTDIFLLFDLIEKGDIIEGYDYRVIKFENQKEKKKVYIKLLVEEIKFSQYGDSLRISGKIIEGDKDIVGHYHTFDVSIGSEIKIIKNNDIPKFYLKELEKASNIGKKVLIISIDNKEIAIANLSENKYNIIYTDYINYKKEDFDIEEKINSVYSNIYKIIEEKNPEIIIIVGPIFYPEKFLNYLKKRNENIEKEKKIYTFRISYGGENGIYEFLRRKEYLEVLKDIEILNVNNIIEDFMENISKEKCVFGYEKTVEMLDIGNLEYILIDREYFNKLKMNDPEKIKEIIEKADSYDINIYFVYPYNNYYEYISKFGIVGKMRYKI